MVRLLAILVLVASGLPRLGVVLADSQDHDCESVCHTPVVKAGCCGHPIVEKTTDAGCGGSGFCVMSGGPCRCGVAPTTSPERRPDAPLPRTDRDSITALPDGPAQITPVSEPDDAAPSMASLAGGIHTGKTHNEVQALLGIWRT